MHEITYQEACGAIVIVVLVIKVQVALAAGTKRRRMDEVNLRMTVRRLEERNTAFKVDIPVEGLGALVDLDAIGGEGREKRHP